MTEDQRKERNNSKLSELFPAFATKIAAIITDLESQGMRPRIQEAWRSPQDQIKAFNTGNSKLKFGYHNITGKNGEKKSMAVDMLDDDHPLNSAKTYLLRLAATAAKQGLQSGIRWGLPPKLRDAIDDAINAQNWGADIKIGWDPTHIEPMDTSPRDEQNKLLQSV